MKWSDIIATPRATIREAPLADIEVHGNPLDQAGSFSDKDRGVMQRNIIAGVYHRRLQAVPFNLYIYVLNVDMLGNLAFRYPEDELNHFLSTHPNYRQPFAPVLIAIERNRQQDPSAIHFVIGDNYSRDNQIVPTAWMLIHRLLHAMMPSGKARINTALPAIADASSIGYNRFFHTFFTFASSRNATVTPLEVTVEMGTQYLMTGDIGLRNLDQLPPRQVSALQKSIAGYKRYLTTMIRKQAGKAFYI